MNADSKVNILMVDDQPSKLLSYEVILSELGENLIKATSASEALSILLKTDIAVVLMDVSMPDLDGFELADVALENGITLRVAIGGKGPPLLLLHGHPQTHVTWRKVAPALAR